VKASCSMFSQILKLIPRTDFALMVKETGAERRSKGLSSWSQFVAMLFSAACSGRRSTTYIPVGASTGPRPFPARDRGRSQELRRQAGPPGIEAPRSSLSYANAHRPWQLFEQVFQGLYGLIAAKQQGKKKFRFKNKLVSLDSTTIDLCLSMYDWAHYRRTKGAVNLDSSVDIGARMATY